jgi:hypothetical protein
MATPLKLRDVNGNIQELTTSEENYIAYQIGLHLGAGDSAEVGSLNKLTGGTTAGTFSNTFFNEPVGTHPSTSITTGTTNTTIYQTNGTAVETDSDVLSPLMWVDSGSETGFKMMPDGDLNQAVDRYLTTIFTNEYPGSYRLAPTSPGGDWTVQQTAFVDTRTDGTSTTYNIYKKTSGSAPTTVRPIYVEDSAGGGGIKLREMLDRQIKYSFGQRAKTRIMGSGIGKYQLRSSTAGAPTDPGTWVAKGTATDTKQTTSQQLFTRDSTVNFQANYTKLYTSNYASNYTKLSTVAYQRLYTSNYTKAYTASYQNEFSLTNYTATYQTGYDNAYQKEFQAGYTGGSYLLTFAGTYTPNYVRRYTGNFNIGYVGAAFNTGFVGPAYLQTYTGNYDPNYLRNFVGNFANSFVTAYQGTYTGNYVPNYVRAYEGNYARNFATAYQGTYTGNYDPNYVRAYEGNYLRNFNRAYLLTYTGNYVPNYLRNFANTFVGGFVGTSFATGFVGTSFAGGFAGGAYAGNYLAASFAVYYTLSYSRNLNYVRNYTGNYVRNIIENVGYLGTYQGDFISPAFLSYFQLGATYGAASGVFVPNILQDDVQYDLEIPYGAAAEGVYLSGIATEGITLVGEDVQYALGISLIEGIGNPGSYLGPEDRHYNFFVLNGYVGFRGAPTYKASVSYLGSGYYNGFLRPVGFAAPSAVFTTQGYTGTLLRTGSTPDPNRTPQDSYAGGYGVGGIAVDISQLGIGPLTEYIRRYTGIAPGRVYRRFDATYERSNDATVGQSLTPATIAPAGTGGLGYDAVGIGLTIYDKGILSPLDGLVRRYGRTYTGVTPLDTLGYTGPSAPAGTRDRQKTVSYVTTIGGANILQGYGQIIVGYVAGNPGTAGAAVYQTDIIDATNNPNIVKMEYYTRNPGPYTRSSSNLYIRQSSGYYTRAVYSGTRTYASVGTTGYTRLTPYDKATYLRNFNVFYTGNYVPNYTRNYTPNYIRNYTPNYQRNFANTFVGGFQGTNIIEYYDKQNYTRNYDRNYVKNRDIGFAGTPIAEVYQQANYTRVYTQNYVKNRNIGYEGAAIGEVYQQANYTRNYTRIYSRTFVGGFAGVAITEVYDQNNYTPNYTRAYTPNYTRAYSSIDDTGYTGAGIVEFYDQVNYTANYVNQYTSNYTKTYTGDYNTQYLATYTSNYDTQYISDYQNEFLANYTAEYIGDYEQLYTKEFQAQYLTDYLGNFVGNFEGETIDATSETNETYTLYVRIA